MRYAMVLAASAAMMMPGAGAAQTTSTGYGSASLVTVRDCSRVAATAACNGSGQPTRQRQVAGGPGEALSSTFEATGAFAGSRASADVSFGALGLPSVKGSAAAIDTARVGSNVLFYQSYRYTGTEAVQFALSGSFHIVGSSTDHADGNMPMGAIGNANLVVWDKAFFPSFETATDMFNSQSAFIGCPGDATGLLAGGRNMRALPGGEARLNLSTADCAGGAPITLTPGAEFVVAGLVQFIANRGGWIDATHTFSVALDTTKIGADDVARLSQNLSFASGVPEPATWALMILGFGAVGAAMRRRTAGRLVQA